MSSPAKSLTVWLVVSVALTANVGSSEPSADGIAYFETHIRPLLAQHCYQCHSARATEHESELRLDSREAWLQGGDYGPSIVPGDVDASLLIQAVRYADPDLEMPPTRQLSTQDIARLEHWVRIGAPAPSDDQIAEIAHPSDPMAGKSHWAFQPIQDYVPPTVQALDWPHSRIDSFVLSRLESAGLSPAADAERRDLLRRTTFQLTGLPPSPQQTHDFLSDQRSYAYQQLVDDLLASPQFGERWGRHWLDLARYADSNGLDENFLFREAWRYRNWVIQAVNEDLPFDRFLLEQIAGDLLPYDSLEQRDRQRIAAGFLVIGPKVLLGNDGQNQRMEIADEQLDSIGRAVLGQTLGCARCHDHKFDPVPTADYYALAGILASTSVMESRYMLGQQRVMERLVGLGLDGNTEDEAYEQYWREHPKLKSRKQHAETALELLSKSDDAGLTALLKENEDALAEDARDADKSLEDRVAAQEAWVAELKSALAHPPTIPPRAMMPADVEKPADEAIRLAGQFDRPGQVVPRGMLTVLCDGQVVEIPSDQSGRLELGQWLTDSQSRAGHLAARVLANRIWQRLIGRGLVRTVDNFGRTGEPPTHPELLDYLARQLIDSGWSVKSLVRTIVLSRTFALSSHYDPANAAIDPENELLWRAHRRRLDAESLRDAMLVAADALDLTPMDSSVWYLGDQATAVGANKVRRRTDFPCRSVYLPVIRNDLPELFEVFDFANPHTATGARPNTIVPTQGLYLLNDASVMDAAEKIANRIWSQVGSHDRAATIDLMFARLLNAEPTPAEQQRLVEFLIETEARLVSAGEDLPVEQNARQALAIACHAVLASSRFQFLE